MTDQVPMRCRTSVGNSLSNIKHYACGQLCLPRGRAKQELSGRSLAFGGQLDNGWTMFGACLQYGCSMVAAWLQHRWSMVGHMTATVETTIIYSISLQIKS